MSADHLTQPIRVLVVDDNVDAAELVADLLSMLGYETSAAHDGESALRVWSTTRPDAVILDLGMPVMDGYEAARQIRKLSKSCLLIALSAWARPADVERGRIAGFDHHIAKPASVEQLLEALHSRLRAPVDLS
ncbi:response regulator [Ramlibacter rhizophilus]|uniref:Response regulator n=1 Tax=Ramlibacter rhizophilus TaxID=1781167 RepID=A0A4Z0C2Y5_9BURK|nr:response regulator [Ramlibacter rhizophilus]TFZ04848.1 response regulator [Ramlibacter rhizophilus]